MEEGLGGNCPLSLLCLVRKFVAEQSQCDILSPEMSCHRHHLASNNLPDLTSSDWNQEISITTSHHPTNITFTSTPLWRILIIS